MITVSPFKRLRHETKSRNWSMGKRQEIWTLQTNKMNQARKRIIKKGKMKIMFKMKRINRSSYAILEITCSCLAIRDLPIPWDRMGWGPAKVIRKGKSSWSKWYNKWQRVIFRIIFIEDESRHSLWQVAGKSVCFQRSKL